MIGITLRSTRQYMIRWGNAVFPLVDLASPASIRSICATGSESLLGFCSFEACSQRSLLLQFEHIPIAEVLESHFTTRRERFEQQFPTGRISPLPQWNNWPIMLPLHLLTGVVSVIACRFTRDGR